ncbi:MAG: ferritin family protein [Nitrososphaerales archaeon]|jgi:VIT1/CCC1 family predicted Fe2+/Mn2+ transporter
MAAVAPALREVAKEGIDDELTDYTLYTRLSESDHNGAYVEVFKQLAVMERRHLGFWQKFVPDVQPRLNTGLIRRALFFKRIFGLTFAIRYLERHEAASLKKYREVAHLVPPEDRADFEAVLADEEKHENDLSSGVESSTIRYISFVVLGLADALVEITGIHAGSLGIYNRTEIAGLAGIIAGGAASLAMASAAYAQAKQGFKGSAKLSAAYTGISYFVTALILATPYFLTSSQFNAIGLSLTLAVVIVTFASYYSSVISMKPFLRDYVELLGILLAVTVALYLFGYVIRVETGITV